MKQASGFTLLELMLAVLIMGLALLSTMEMFVYSFSLRTADKSLTIAQSQAAQKIEQLYSLDYADLRSAYTDAGALKETPFDVYDVGGQLMTDMKGSVYAQELSGAAYALMRVKAEVSYKLSNNRIVGEDTTLNGRLDAGEDQNGNGELDSPGMMETVIVNK
jgi:prepilin-type N-terminal cleavage/methylation domain-containing protein